MKPRSNQHERLNLTQTSQRDRSIERSTNDVEMESLRTPSEWAASVKIEIKQEYEFNELESIISSNDIIQKYKKELIDSEETASLDSIEYTWSDSGIKEESAPLMKLPVSSTTSSDEAQESVFTSQVSMTEDTAMLPAEDTVKPTTSWRTPVPLTIDTVRPTVSWRTLLPPAVDTEKLTASWGTPLLLAVDTEKPTASCSTPVPSAVDTEKQTASWRTPVPLAANTAQPTASWRTPEPPAGPRPAKQPRKANVKTKNNHRRQQWNVSKPVQNYVTTPVDTCVSLPVKEPVALKPLMKCDPNRDVPTPEEKTMYQYRTLERLRSFQRPGTSVVLLKRFTSDLEGYVGTLKTIDYRFLHSPQIMRMVVSKLEPYVLSSWCDYAAQHHKGRKPLILTMLDFLHQKVEIGFRYWYPFTKDGMLSSRKRKYPDFSD